ncbi:HSP20 family protein [Marchantia polymorpha subsp. ruderalis]|uniref:SHSP domain-containing protein n=2 Tax=Marchantia polymorpha TaxID=3197 RepID=A0A176VV99_MARPO|nr:hypothetical protein AXG93_2402s1140 [Marchantia polymorpha subsp. ruderalis]PTQ39425.1 hypothetical protein MARPO_0045s0084 [Marchantia polymorpha]BBN15463.1 hypothetical protein Mp_6g19790 [Marchantia polymorpha subsp. ruderalis]|eukprot:PTQ39425.1 hypothetical protein MARPO_0045s0084 [Marchantia polymorpha]
MAFYMFQFPEEYEKHMSQPQKTYVRDSKAMANTAVDVKDLPNAYQFIADMPGIKSSDVKVELENGNVLKISGVRKRDDPTPDTKYLKIERSAGEFMRKFTLPEDANKDAITAACQHGILTVTVPKVPPPEPAKPRSIEVKVG